MLNEKIDNLLKWSERYAKTDMKYAVRGGFWLNLGRIGLFLASFITLMAFSRFVSQETYGAYQYIISVMALFVVFSLPGINTSIIKSIVQKKEGTFKEGLKEKLKLSLLGSFFLLLVSSWYFFRGHNIFGLTFLATALFFPFFKSFNIYHIFWQAKKDFKKKSLYMFLSAIFSALFLVLVLFFTENIFYIISAYLIGYSFFDFIFLKKTLKKLKNEEVDKEAISFGKHLSLIKSIPDFVAHLDRVIIWHFLGPIQVAVYSFSYLPVNKIKGLFPISQLALPKLGERDIGSMKEKIKEKTKKLFLLMIPVVAVLYFLSSFFYQIFFPQYLDSVIYFQGFLFLLLLVPFQIINSSLIVALKKRELYTSGIISSLLKLVLFLILIPLLNIWGAVLAILIGELSKELINLYYFFRI